jgi:hypothetical protein
MHTLSSTDHITIPMAKWSVLEMSRLSTPDQIAKWSEVAEILQYGPDP